MIACNNCGKELEAGQTFCPFCGSVQNTDATSGAPARPPVEASTSLQRVPTDDRASAAEATRTATPPQTASFSSFEKPKDDTDTTRRTMFVVVALISLALIAGLIWLATRPRAQSVEPRLEGAIRPGSTEFAQFADRLVLEFDADENAGLSERAIGDVVVTMLPTVRNFTGRTISGLEMRAVGLDLSNQTVKERTFIIIPTRQPTLEPNKTITPSLLFEGIKKDNVPASLKVEITGVKFK